MNLRCGHRLTLVYVAGAAVPAVLALLALITMAGLGTPTSGASVPKPGADGFDVGRVLVTIVVVVVAAHGGGVLARLAHQPRVVGQAVVGLLLGPSVLGYLAPKLYQWLHGGGSSQAIDLLAHLGVILFVFLIARETAGTTQRSTSGQALVIGHAMISLPFLCGVLVAALLVGRYRPAGVGPLPYALFLGLAMSATALPVLAHILAERRMLTSRIGTLATSCAAVGDATLWCLLAVTVCLVHRGSLTTTLARAAAALAFAALLWWAVRPALRRLARPAEHTGPGRPVLLLAGLLLCAQVTESLGLHAIFGAFLLGLVVPRTSLTAQRVTVMAEGLTEWLLLPLFFTAIGSRTHLDVIGGPATIGLCLAVLAIAMLSKLVAAGGAARAVGLSWRDGAVLGVLMNCRGLTELLILNVGLTTGIIEGRVFACFVVMAVATTALTGPLLDALRLRAPGADPEGARPDRVSVSTASGAA